MLNEIEMELEKCIKALGQIKDDQLNDLNRRSLLEVQSTIFNLVNKINAMRGNNDTAPIITPIESPPPKAPERQKAKPQALSAPCIVIVDDDEDIQKTLQYIIPRKSEFRVVSVTDATEALETIKKINPQIILLDLMMPHITGFELMKQIRQIPELNHIKIIVGSSRSYEKDRIKALQEGANEFIAKPYNFGELILRLHQQVA